MIVRSLVGWLVKLICVLVTFFMLLRNFLWSHLRERVWVCECTCHRIVAPPSFPSHHFPTTTHTRTYH
jgi:hypothetical protein